MNMNLMYRRLRNLCGLLGGLLPWIAVFSVLLIDNRPARALWSISATYYLSPALVGILTAACIVLITYDGYGMLDNIVTTASGILGFGIVLFPCSVSWLDKTASVGFFQIPMNISSKIHGACAAAFFILLAFNSFFLFTKSGIGKMTEKKKLRNRVYRVCGAGMCIFMVWQAVTVLMHMPGWWTMFNEIFLLTFFSISWLVKGGAIVVLND